MSKIYVKSHPRPYSAPLPESVERALLEAWRRQGRDDQVIDHAIIEDLCDPEDVGTDTAFVREPGRLDVGGGVAELLEEFRRAVRLRLDHPVVNGETLRVRSD